MNPLTEPPLKIQHLSRIALAILHRSFQYRVMSEEAIPWPHAPPHRLSSAGTYFCTAGTYLKQHHFAGKNRLRRLQHDFFNIVRQFSWQLEAWAFFSNHYHFVAHSPEHAESALSLSELIMEFHGKTAAWANQLDQAQGRRVWFNYRETRLTFHRSYLARLNYVHQNAVKHRLVPIAVQYPWCSARWLKKTASSAQIKTLARFKWDQLQVYDEFEVDSNW